MTFRGRSQDTNKGHIGRPVLPMSPAAEEGAPRPLSGRSPETAPGHLSPASDTSEAECISFYSCCGEHKA